MGRYKLWISLFPFLSLLRFPHHLMEEQSSNGSSRVTHNGFGCKNKGKTDKTSASEPNGDSILSERTKKLIKELDDPIRFTIYLDGELPSSFGRLRSSLRERLDHLKAYRPKMVHYEFIDPDSLERSKVKYKELNEKGLNRMILHIQKKGDRTEKIVFPGAIVRYQGREVAMNLLNERSQRPTSQDIDKAIGNLGYRIDLSIKRVKRERKPKIAFLQGHGELRGQEVIDATREMKKSYKVEEITIDGELDALNNVDALIVAKPDSAFSEKDQYVIDQFIMDGEKVMWLVDPMEIRMNSLKKRSTVKAIPQTLGLKDQILSYGVRLNEDLIMDQNCAPLGVITDEFKGRPKIERHGRYYFPTVSADHIGHPISSNIDPVRMRFVSSLDTVQRDSVEHSVLLNSSRNVKIKPSPIRVSMEIVTEDPAFENSERSYVPTGVLMEGKFRSFFQGNPPPKVEKSDLKKRSERTRILVVGDGDVIRNEVRKGDQAYPLGYEKHSNKRNKVIYGNKDFIMNGLKHLLSKRKSATEKGVKSFPKFDPDEPQEEVRQPRESHERSFCRTPRCRPSTHHSSGSFLKAS